MSRKRPSCSHDGSFSSSSKLSRKEEQRKQSKTTKLNIILKYHYDRRRNCGMANEVENEEELYSSDNENQDDNNAPPTGYSPRRKHPLEEEDTSPARKK